LLPDDVIEVRQTAVKHAALEFLDLFKGCSPSVGR